MVKYNSGEHIVINTLRERKGFDKFSYHACINNYAGISADCE